MASQPMSTQLASQAQSAATQAMNQTNMVMAAASAITAQQAMIIDAYRGQIYISNSLDVQDTPVYDTDTYTAGQTIDVVNSQLFTNVENSTGKGPAQTNMTQNGKLDAPEAMSVFGIRLGWQENVTFADLISLLNLWDFEFYLGKKIYQQATLRHFGSGWGITGYTTNTATQFLTNGSTDSRSMHILAVKLVIANQMSFRAQLNGGPTQVLSGGGTGLTLLCELNGLYARGVQ